MISKTFKTILCLILALTVMLPVFPAYAESDTAVTDKEITESYDIESLTFAVDTGDTDYLLRYYMSVAKEYYLEHGLDKDFPYFNADKYLEMYDDVATLTGGDRYKALLHYIEKGLFEHRKSGTSFDPYTVVARYPMILIVYTVRSSEKNPALFVEAVFRVYEDYEQIGKAYSSNTSQNEVGVAENKKFTMLYLACTGNHKSSYEWTWSKNICRALLGAYEADDDFNLVFLLGGNQTWQSDFLQKELGLKYNNGSYKNAVYAVDREALKEAVEAYMAKYDYTLGELEAAVESYYTYDPNYTNDSILNHLVTGEVLKREADTFAGSIAESQTITDFIIKAKEIYPADNYGLIIGGHGGGSTSGSPQSATNGPQKGNPILLVKDLGAALSSAKVDDEPFSIMIYDSCLMGCSEIADYLSPYYKYLYACETVSWRGSTNYAEYFPYISKVRNEDDLAYLLASKAFDLVYKEGMNTRVLFRTGAIFDSTKTETAMSSLNKVANKLNSIIKDKTILASDKKALYNSMKLASICSYQLSGNTGYLDLRDFLIKLKTCFISLTDMSTNISNDTRYVLEDLCEEDGLLNDAIKAADDLTMENLHMVQDFFVYSSNDGNGNPVSITSELWNKYYDYQLCGASIYFPTFLISNIRAMYFYRIGSLSEYITELTKNYQTYRNQGYDDYLDLIKLFIDFQYSGDEFNLRKTLSYSLSGVWNNDSNKYETYRDLINLSLRYATKEQKAEECYISVTAKDYSTDTDTYKTNGYSSGNVVTDIMDTINTQNIKLYLTKYFECIPKTGTTTVPPYADVILASYLVTGELINVKYHSESSDTSNLMTIPAKSLSNVKLTYISNTNKTTVDWVYEAEFDKNQKLKILKETSPDIETNRIDDYVLYAGNYTAVEGSEEYSGNINSTTYHVFDKTNRKYICTVSTANDGTFCLVDKVKTINFYHNVAEKLNNYSDKIGYIEKSDKVSLKSSGVVFSVPNNGLKLTEIALCNAIKNGTDYDYDEFGYILSINRIESEYGGPRIIINDYDDTTGMYVATFIDADEYSDGDELNPSDEEWVEDEEFTDSVLDEEILPISNESVIDLSEPDSDEVKAMDEDESNNQNLPQNVEDTVVEDKNENKAEIVLCSAETEAGLQNETESLSSVKDAEPAEVAQQTEAEIVSFAENAGPAEAA